MGLRNDASSRLSSLTVWGVCACRGDAPRPGRSSTRSSFSSSCASLSSRVRSEEAASPCPLKSPLGYRHVCRSRVQLEHRGFSPGHRVFFRRQFSQAWRTRLTPREVELSADAMCTMRGAESSNGKLGELAFACLHGSSCSTSTESGDVPRQRPTGSYHALLKHLSLGSL